jgi:hypothetical protein
MGGRWGSCHGVPPSIRWLRFCKRQWSGQLTGTRNHRYDDPPTRDAFYDAIANGDFDVLHISHYFSSYAIELARAHARADPVSYQRHLGLTDAQSRLAIEVMRFGSETMASHAAQHASTMSV